MARMAPLKFSFLDVNGVSILLDGWCGGDAPYNELVQHHVNRNLHLTVIQSEKRNHSAELHMFDEQTKPKNTEYFMVVVLVHHVPQMRSLEQCAPQGRKGYQVRTFKIVPPCY